MRLQDLFEKYDVTKRIIVLVKDEGFDLRTMTIILNLLLVITIKSWRKLSKVLVLSIPCQRDVNIAMFVVTCMKFPLN
jgi:hypothetical protein